MNDVAFLHADDAAVTTCHSEVCNKGRAFMQQPLVSGLYVRMRAINNSNSAVEMPTHRAFFGSGLCVHVDDSDFHIRIERIQQLVRNAKGIISRGHENASEQIDYCDAGPVYFANPHSLSGGRGRIIRRS